jgi:putative FmdB family regulatory protein
MPLYTNKCDQCEHHFDELSKWTDPPVTCPICKTNMYTHRLLAPVAKIEGIGIHVNQYGKKYDL